MKILNYDSETKESISETDAKANPLEFEAFLLPANAVYADDFPLPTLLANEVAVWDGAGAWVVTPDFRNDESWFIISTGKIKEFELGESPDALVSQTFPTAIQTQLDEALRVSEIRSAGLSLIQTTFPALNDIEEISFQAEFWLSIALSSRQPTAKFQKVIDIYQLAKEAIANGVTQEVDIIWP